ncbi:hypothetical protein IMG5_106410 [Ichthyophthirius multifiliis]|uniref:Transmembrane protein n=1 Tax=Ichthyophthirius multifiliis TaxID=5932 RepID=G0QT64_ICHMU|nr:hypothetical protein IMG5_106410 [Ichthyophthirius multifiliis]EGR31589.1 hypothetical protein IMG5_106410 [Ichthyophthirius multifiliis]|eukprot:XP_004035075.1 hypothetical protein IMG5_106410 [Ichthyophthirius multifiliis]
MIIICLIIQIQQNNNYLYYINIWKITQTKTQRKTQYKQCYVQSKNLKKQQIYVYIYYLYFLLFSIKRLIFSKTYSIHQTLYLFSANNIYNKTVRYQKIQSKCAQRLYFWKKMKTNYKMWTKGYFYFNKYYRFINQKVQIQSLFLRKLYRKSIWKIYIFQQKLGFLDVF